MYINPSYITLGVLVYNYSAEYKVKNLENQQKVYYNKVICDRI